ncbi:MAG: carbamoyl phosphate synthase small subunit, partial [Pseudomonadota bacterium]
RVVITSQNHGFAVADDDLPTNIEVSHRSLFDHTIQGIRALDRPAFSVQYHPEASPGPMDSDYLFDRFLSMVNERGKV